MVNIVILLKIPYKSPLFHAHSVDQARFQPISGPLRIIEGIYPRLNARGDVDLVQELVNDDPACEIGIVQGEDVLARRAQVTTGRHSGDDFAAFEEHGPTFAGLAELAAEEDEVRVGGCAWG